MSIIVIEMVMKYGTPNVTKILQQRVFVLKIDFQFLKIDEFRFSKIDLIFLFLKIELIFMICHCSSGCKTTPSDMYVC